MLFFIFKSALQKIKSNYTHFFLATIGIIISSFVMLVILCFYGISENILIEYLRSSYSGIEVLTIKIDDNDYFMNSSEIIDLKSHDGIENVSFQTGDIIGGNISGNENVRVSGTYLLPFTTELVCGKELSEYEYLDSECRNIIIHDSLAKSIFNSAEAAVGKSLFISADSGKKYEFLVSGVYKNTLKDYESKEIIYASFSMVSRILGSTDKIPKFSVRADDVRNVSNLKLYLSSVMRSRYPLDSYDYKIMVSDIIKSVDTLISLITSVFFVFACVIFWVSGINIRNVLLSVMNQYIHLIGIQKAIGADEKIITAEYMMQGFIISFVGTTVSIGGFFGVSVLLNNNMGSICKYISLKTNLDFLANISIHLSINIFDIIISVALSFIIVMICCYSSVNSSVKTKIVDLLRN